MKQKVHRFNFRYFLQVFIDYTEFRPEQDPVAGDDNDAEVAGVTLYHGWHSGHGWSEVGEAGGYWGLGGHRPPETGEVVGYGGRDGHGGRAGHGRRYGHGDGWTRVP